jgi:hypothetical protein
MIIKISLSANNEELSIKALDLIKHLGLGVTLEPSTDYNWRTIYRRFHYDDCDICVGMDEDVFFIDPNAILSISEYMIKNKIPFMAMRELSGVSGHRKICPNATEKDYNSFLMFTQPKLIPYMGTIESILEKYTTKEWIEPYWMIFRYLYDMGIKGEEFKGTDHFDHISTVLTWNDLPFCVHTWFARSYTHCKVDEYGINQNGRINLRYKEVLGEC